MKTVLRYAGGKSRAIKKITPFVEDYDVVVSPFLGGGSLEVYWASNGKKVVGADIFDVLINFWDNILHRKEEVVEELKRINPTKEDYDRVKESLMKTPQVQKMLASWKTDFYKREPEEISPTKLAAYYYFNHNCSYGPGFLGWPSKVYLQEKSWKKQIQNILNFECPNLVANNRRFESTILEAGNELLYLDPPYYLMKDGDNKMFKGIYPMRNIPVHHDSFDHEKLRDMLLDYEGDFVLSYNNCETIRRYYSDFDFYYPEWFYSMGQGETRIGKNRAVNEKEQNKHVKESHEILIVKRSK